jgi:hypothetical protein
VDIDDRIRAKVAGQRVHGRRNLTRAEWQRFNEVRAAAADGKTTIGELVTELNAGAARGTR